MLNAMNKDIKNQNNTLLLLSISFIVSFFVGMVYIIVSGIFLPSTDLANNQNLLETFSDPFVYTIAGTYIFASGFVFAPLVFYCLKRKNLKVASIFILGAALLWIIIVTPFSISIGLVGTYLISFVSLLCCKFTRIKALEFRGS